MAIITASRANGIVVEWDLAVADGDGGALRPTDHHSAEDRTSDGHGDEDVDSDTASGEAVDGGSRHHNDTEGVAPRVIDLAAARDEARRFLRRAGSRTQTERIRMLLTVEQEVGLAVLMRDEETSLSSELPNDFRHGLDGNSEPARAFDALVIHNIRLVWSVAQRYIGQADGLTAEDVAAYGQLGLIRAVQKFDASKGFKFSTYATWWIRQSITRALADFGRTIRIPVHMHERMLQTRAAYERLLTRGIRPQLAALAAATGFMDDEVVRHLELLRGVHSLDAPTGEDGITLKDYLVDRTEGDGGLGGVELLALREEVDAVLGTLTEREANVIKLRLGFVDGETWTLDEIGRVYGVTRERIRQIEGKALQKLREGKRRSRLQLWA